MLKNYCKTAWRNISKNRLFSAINILGLSIGIAFCFMIMLFVHDELSYDRFNEHADRIVRVVFNASINGGKIKESGVMAPVAQTIKNDYPEVQEATRLLKLGDQKIFYANKVFKNEQVALSDPQLFGIFTIQFVEGDPKTAMSLPHTAVITRTAAEKYFGKEEPIGKILGMNNATELYRVTGVIEDLPSNSHFHFDFIASMASFEGAKSQSWMYGSFHTYLLLKPGVDYKQLETKFPAMVEKYMGPQVQQEMGLSLQQFRTKGNQLGFSLQPLTSIHLHADTSTEFEAGGNASYVYVFGAIAIFMLLIACINFVNLSTASASKRAKEVGIRKVIGSGKAGLIKQFMFESALLVCIALAISCLLIQWGLPVFNEIANKKLTFGFDMRIIAAYIVLGLVVTLIAGIYPAFVLSSFTPALVLKGKFSNNKSFGLRSALVIFQFFISVALIISTLVVWQQMKYIQNKKLGYDKDHLLIIPNSVVLGHNEQVYENQILKDPRVLSATVSRYKPVGPSDENNALAYPQGHDNQILKALEYHIDEQYIPTMDMQMVVGRNFSKGFATDSTAIIINESAAQAFGWGTTTAIGKTIIRENSSRGKNVPFHVIGVLKNFNFRSLHESISPLLMTLEPENGLIFKIKTTDIQGLLATMKTEWDKFNTDEPFAYSFMDDLYNKTYSAEQKTATVLKIFASLTILVACLGLFGLATYSAEQRTKEIGVRKVLGASVAQITQMLSKDFIKLVAIACLIAFPVTWWAMNRWLQSFAYRIQFSWWLFLLTGVSAILIALITVSFQAIKAAIANPVKSLRAE